VNNQLVVAVDFDGTLCEYAFPDCGPPRQEIIEALRRLRTEGWRIIIHSARVNSEWPEPGRTEKCEAMVLYLVTYDVPFDEVWGLAFERISTDEGTQGYQWWFEPRLTGKPVAHVYLDDRAVAVADGCLAGEILRVCREIADRANEEHEGRGSGA